MKSSKKPTYKDLEAEIAKLKLDSTIQKETGIDKSSIPQDFENSEDEQERKVRFLFENITSAFVHAKVIYENEKAIDFEFI